MNDIISTSKAKFKARHYNSQKYLHTFKVIELAKKSYQDICNDQKSELSLTRQWHSKNFIAPRQCKYLADEMANNSEGESRIYTPWMNTIFHKQIMEEYSMLEALAGCEVLEGDINDLLPHEKEFIHHLLSLEDLMEIRLTRELGYADVWMVFPALSVARELEITAFCVDYQKQKRKNNPDIGDMRFLPLTPHNFTGEGPPAVIRLMVEGSSGEWLCGEV